MNTINIITCLILFTIIASIFLWIVFGGKNVRKKEKLYNPMFAKKMDRMDGKTSNKGSMAFVVSPRKWTIINWNKEKGFLEIIVPPQGYLKQKDRVVMATLNWAIVKECPSEKVTVEKYFANRRIM